MSSRILRSLATAALLGSVGCGNSGTGTLAVQLVDAPADVKSIFVTIESVTAHSEEAGWVTIFTGPLTVDLLTLQDTSMKLGKVKLPAGTVSEVRFQLVEGGPQYVVLTDNSQAPLKVPSGTSSGVKLKGPFTVSACNIHTLVIDFDGKNSIEYHQTGGPTPEWILRPVIHVKAEADEPESCNTPDGGNTTDGGNTPPDGGSPGDYPTDGGSPYPPAQ
jgi:hypothetical protein